jgi:hypothetical protein
MDEQISLAITFEANGNISAGFGVIPVVDGQTDAINIKSAAIGLHNISNPEENEFVKKISEAIAIFRAAKGI